MSLIRKFTVYLVVLTAVAGLFFGARLYAENSKKAQAATQAQSDPGTQPQTLEAVKICRVFPMPLTDVLKLPATVEAYDDIDLATQIGGTIEWIGPREGDRVTKGERLLQIDVAAGEAQVTRARAAYELAQTKHKRLEKLLEQNIIAAEEFDDAAAALKTTAAAFEEAQVHLRHGTLVSPIDGVLDRRYADTGEHIDLGKPVMRIVHIDKVKVMVNVPEKDVLYFKRGQTVDLVFDNGIVHDFTGTVDWIAMTAEPATRTYPMKVIVENPEHTLRPGMIVNASLVRRQIDEAIVVPFFTIVDREEGKAIYVVENGVARERRIEYGVFQGGTVEIKSGLVVGDQLVIVGQRRLVDGQSVRVDQDLTEMARQFMTHGGDLSKLMLEMNQ